MENPSTECKVLVDVTANVLDGEALQAIFISTQQVSLEISTKFSIK